MATTIAENLARVEERICAAAARAGRARGEITLVGVTKTQSAGAVLEAYAAGLREFGENRVQEWEGKRGELLALENVRWHLIGHLQSNKAGRAARIFDCVDSVDDLAVAGKISRAWLERVGGGKKMRLLIELRVAEEETKSGVGMAELAELAERVVELEGVELAGLMCVPPFLEATEVRPYFAKLREARNSLAGRLGKALPVLSMGMTHDLEAGILEGSTEVRVGTGLFGERGKAK
jgi:pyridoxal phosphate enzyme (YggS family)